MKPELLQDLRYLLAKNPSLRAFHGICTWCGREVAGVFSGCLPQGQDCRECPSGSMMVTELRKADILVYTGSAGSLRCGAV